MAGKNFMFVNFVNFMIVADMLIDHVFRNFY